MVRLPSTSPTAPPAETSFENVESEIVAELSKAEIPPPM
jgi:hypothetical protein